MSPDNNLATITFAFLVTCGMITALLAAYTWPQRGPQRHGGALVLTLAAVASAFFAHALTFAGAIPATTRANLVAFEYLGWIIAPVAMLYYISRITGRDTWIRQRYPLAAVIIIQIAFAVIIAVPTTRTIFFSGGVDPETFTFDRTAPIYLAFYAWTYFVFAATAWKVIITAIRSPRLHRLQVATVLAVLAFPWVFSALAFTNTLFIRINPTVLSLIPAALLVFSVGHFRTFDLRPITEEEKNLASGSGVIVLDNHSRITAINASAVQLLGTGRSSAMGWSIEDVWSDRPAIVAALRGAPLPGIDIISANGTGHLRFTSSAITSTSGRPQGTIVTVTSTATSDQNTPAREEAPNA